MLVHNLLTEIRIVHFFSFLSQPLNLKTTGAYLLCLTKQISAWRRSIVNVNVYGPEDTQVQRFEVTVNSFSLCFTFPSELTDKAVAIVMVGLSWGFEALWMLPGQGGLTEKRY